MNAYGFMPHGFCFEWRPGVLWLHVLSDLGTATAYFGIGILLFYFTRKRRDLPFQSLFWLFASFIVLCGTTHLLSIWVLWHADYYVEGMVKALTAIVSIATLITLGHVLPKVLQATGSLQTLVATQNMELTAVNAELRAQIAARETIELALRQSQKMEAIGQLTGGIAHDFNNMLQAIGGSLELVQMRVKQNRTAEVGRYVETARKTVDRAAALTNRLLAFARRQPLQPRPVEVDALIMGLEELIRGTIKAGGPAIVVEMKLASGGTVLCDPNQLESAILNIAINARDAMPEGGRLTICSRQASTETPGLAEAAGAVAGDFVEIAMTDTGVGMDEPTRQRVFEPFFTTKPLGHGTGLGLSQVYGFARQSGGLATIESRHGEGATVRIFLPCCEKPPTPPEPELGPEPAAARATLLLVEDEPSVRAIAADYLRELNYLVLEAEDAPRAIELLRRTPVLDLLVTDVGLPNGMNGRQLADAGRELKPALPVLFITGYAGDADIDNLAPGMRIARKPFTLPALAVQIAAMLDRPRPAHA